MSIVVPLTTVHRDQMSLSSVHQQQQSKSDDGWPEEGVDGAVKWYQMEKVALPEEEKVERLMYHWDGQIKGVIR